MGSKKVGHRCLRRQSAKAKRSTDLEGDITIKSFTEEGMVQQQAP